MTKKLPKYSRIELIDGIGKGVELSINLLEDNGLLLYKHSKTENLTTIYWDTGIREGPNSKTLHFSCDYQKSKDRKDREIMWSKMEDGVEDLILAIDKNKTIVLPEEGEDSRKFLIRLIIQSAYL